MITWMQRHRKYLVITIWISTIAFVGAGFVGWGQYSYGDKASAIAKVGDVPITQRNFQQAYSNLYAQYNQLFQGNFDEAKAKEFGLQQQAFRSLIDAALILNLANEYKLRVSDRELYEYIKAQPYFYKNGAFDKDTYKKVLMQSKMTMKEYEDDIRKSLLAKKVLHLLLGNVTELEKEAYAMSTAIADKIRYKLLSPSMISIAPTQEELKKFWENRKFDYMSEPRYTIETVRVAIEKGEHSEEQIVEYYKTHKLDFRGLDGKILPLNEVKEGVTAALDAKETNKKAKKIYIAYKKGKLDASIQPAKESFTQSTSPYALELFNEIAALDTEKPFLKPRKVGNEFVIIKLIKVTASKPKSFEEAKTEVEKQFVSQERQKQLLTLAQESVKNFQGDVTDFLSIDDVSKVSGLESAQAKEFLDKIFKSEQKRGYIELSDGNIVLYDILEQKMLKEKITNDTNAVARIKSMLLDRGLVKLLEDKYPTEIFVKGL